MATSSTQAWSFGDGRFSFTAPLGQAPTVGTPVVVTRPAGRERRGQGGRTVLAGGASGRGPVGQVGRLAPGEGAPEMNTDVGDVQVLGDGDLVASLGQVDAR